MSTLDESRLCFPHLGNSSCKKSTQPHSMAVLIYIVLSVISVLTVTLNLLVITTVSYFKKLHCPTNFLLVSLAVSDVFVGFLFIFQILVTDGCWYIGAYLCLFYKVFCLATAAASIGTVVLISIDRYIAVCDPLHYSTKFSANRAKLFIVLCWFHTVVYLPMFIEDMKNPGRSDSCVGECNAAVHQKAKPLHFVLTYVIPVCTIVFLYARVFMVVVSQARAMHSQVGAGKPQGAQKVNRSELKAARVLGVVVVAFLVCLTPFYIAAFSDGFVGLSMTSIRFVLCLYYFSSGLNPMIYVFFYPWFRKCLKLIFSPQILKPGSRDANIL